MVDELLPLAAERGDGLAWEYYFTFGGGSPPWVSGMAQGTAVQALARAATRLGREAEMLPLAQRALAIFEAPTPQGVRVPDEHGTHYAIYSFAPDLRVLNGFLQSLIGLYDYARLDRRPARTALFAAGERAGAPRGPGRTTPARGRCTRAGALSASPTSATTTCCRDFLANLCKRTETAVYCDDRRALRAYKSQPPVVAVRDARCAAAPGRVRSRSRRSRSVDLRIRAAARSSSRAVRGCGYGSGRSAGRARAARAGTRSR